MNYQRLAGSVLSAALLMGCGVPADRAQDDSAPAAAPASETAEPEETTSAPTEPVLAPALAEASTPAAEPESTAVDSTETKEAVYAENGIALDGTDPVAYFTQGQPMAGSPDYTHRWRGVTWQFSSSQHRDLFAQAPERYAPAYGGYCAWAVSQGYTAPIDPNAWRIVADRLYLNFDRSVQQRWERDIPGHIQRADQNWPGLADSI